MRQIYSVAARPELQKYVRAFAQREIIASTEDIVQPCPASLEQILQLDFASPPIVDYEDGTTETASRISIVGPHTYRRLCIRLRGPVESFAIFFQPLGVWQLLRIPMGLLVNRAYKGEDLFGKQIAQFWQRMGEVESFGERVLLAERFLLSRLAKASILTSVMDSAIYIFQSLGATTVNQLASGIELSVRQFERRFMAEMGMTPKLFARVTRYQMALDAKITSPGRSWLNIAHEFGYHDQMHMIRDFQALSGASPSRIVLQLGDMRPSALAAS